MLEGAEKDSITSAKSGFEEKRSRKISPPSITPFKIVSEKNKNKDISVNLGTLIAPRALVPKILLEERNNESFVVVKKENNSSPKKEGFVIVKDSETDKRENATLAFKQEQKENDQVENLQVELKQKDVKSSETNTNKKDVKMSETNTKKKDEETNSESKVEPTKRLQLKPIKTQLEVKK